MSLAGMEWLRAELESAQGRQRVAQAQQLALVARDLGCSLPQLAIAWCLRNPRVSTVILGATSSRQLQENLTALEVLPRLDAAVLERIEAIVQTKPTGRAQY
jgi:aryl-alcohol dehydrogenase-like predicted oxidoreductase